MTATNHQAAAAPIVTLEQITKAFPGVVANDNVDLQILPGEVHVLLGENGAGKSTLIGLLSGLQQPDSGSIQIDGTRRAITSPRHALSLGIGTVFQHTMLVPSLTIAENLLLGGPWWERPRKERLRERVDEISKSLGIAVDLDAYAHDLSLGEQQQVEILRALIRDSRVLILDESTSMLTPKGIEELGSLMRRLVERGLAIIFITHKLNEAVSFGDRISVLKLGRKVGEIGPDRFKSLDKPELTTQIVDMMFGGQHSEDEQSFHEPRPISRSEPPVLVMDEVTLASTSTAPGLNAIHLELHAGELLGIAGIDGNGQKQLADALSGQTHIDGGSVTLNGVRIETCSVGERRDAGLRYLTDDRLGEGTVGAFPVSLNFLLKQIGSPPYWHHQMERRGDIDKHAEQLVRDYDVRTPGVHTPVGRLSGGNIQKVLLARELADGAKVVIFNKPTYGLDLSNTVATRQRIRDIAAGGLGVLLISTDLEELLELCDRIAVMDNGSLAGIVENGENARTEVGRLMVGLHQ